MPESQRFPGRIEAAPRAPLRVRQRARHWLLQIAGLRYRGGRQPVPHSILLIRPDHLGDMLFLTPALHALRVARPDLRISLLAGPWSARLVRENPDLDEVLTCDFPGFERQPKSGLLDPYRRLFRQAKVLRAKAYDTAVVLRFDHWWGAWLAAEAGIPRRVGYDLPENRSFLTEAIAYRPHRHEVQQNATLLATLNEYRELPLGPTRYTLDAADREWATAWLAARGLGDAAPLIAIHPGAGAAVKRWPATSWAEIADALVARHGARVLLTGGPGEEILTRAVADAMSQPALDLAGKTTLGQLAALQAHCRLVLGADAGPMHLAVAVGAATIHLHGPVDPAKFGPWGDVGRHLVLRSPWTCAPCNRLDWPLDTLPQHACMAAIHPEQVLEAAERLLVNRPGAPDESLNASEPGASSKQFITRHLITDALMEEDNMRSKHP